MNYYSAIQRRKSCHFQHLNLEDIVLSEIRQRQMPHDLIKQTNKKKELTDTEKILVVSRGRGWAVGKLG